MAWAVTLLALFLLGGLAHRQGLFGQVRSWVGLDEQSLFEARTLMAEPGTALASRLAQARLPTLRIDVAFRHLQALEEKRREALRLGLLFTSDADLVPADVSLGDRTVPVDLRLKGDLVDHLRKGKWSFRVEVDGDAQLFGMRRFSLQHPETRNYLYEWGWLETLRREGVLAPRYHFVRVVLNGSDKGIYALEEFLHKELLESQGRREGVIVTFDETAYWERRSQVGEANLWMSDPLLHGGFRNAVVDVRGEARVRSDSLLGRQRDAAVGLLRSFQEGRKRASEVFDVPLLARFLAVSELWYVRHGLIWNNLQFYYNPIAGTLEPVAFDGTPFDAFDDGRPGALIRPWSIQALSDPVAARAYVRELHRVTSPDYLERIRGEIGAEHDSLRTSLFLGFPAVRTSSLWADLRVRQRSLRRALAAERLVLAFHEEADARRDGEPASVTVRVRSVATLPVELLGFRIGSTTVDAAQLMMDSVPWASVGESSVVFEGSRKPITDIASYLRQAPRFATFRVPVAKSSEAEPAGSEVGGTLRARVRLVGSPETREIPVRPYRLQDGQEAPRAPSLSDVTSRHPFLSYDPTTGGVKLLPGDWTVEEDLVLPEGVRVTAEPGTVLRFANEAVFLSRGALDLRGTADDPIVLRGADGSWPGLVVLDADATSVLEHVEIRDTRGIQRGGWTLTGGVTFYRSPVQLVRSRITASQAEDAINVVHGEFEFLESYFGQTSSDAFDGDFTQGAVRRCVFEEIGGDALDFSGSTVVIEETTVRDVSDKGISAGESSEVTVSDFEALNTGIAIVSKDLSKVRVARARIEGARHAGLAAFIKKPEFGPASIAAIQVEFRDTPRRTLVQTGSWVELGGRMIEGTDLDVEALYEAGVLGS